MTAIGRLKIDWTGFIGAPGYTNLYFRDFSSGTVDQAMADGFLAKVDTWLDALVPYLPTSVSILVNPTVDVITEETGQIESFLTISPDTARNGSGSGVYAAPAGACVNWSTNGVRNGRRVRGRTFLVPLTSTATENNGTLAGTPLTTMRNATAALISTTGSGDLGVWSRPSAPGASDGIWYVVTGFTIPDKVAILTSRRD